MRSRRTGKKKTQARVYKYGLPDLSARKWPEKPDTIHKAVGQMRLGNYFRNELAKIECARRAVYHQTLAELDPAVARANEGVRELEAMLQAHRAAIQDGRSGTRRRKQDPEGKGETQALEQELKNARAQRSQLEKKARQTEEAQARLAALDAREHRACKAAYAACKSLGLRPDTLDFWRTVKRAHFRKGPKPRLRRFDGSGVIAVALKSDGARKGYSLADVMGEGEHSRAARRLVQIDLEPTRRRQGRRFGTLRVRVGSQGKARAPIFAAWPILWHRDLPAEARLKGVRVVAKRVAGHVRWHACIQVDLPTAWRTEPPGSGRVALDLGWRRTQEEGAITAEVGRWRGDDGATGTICVPPEVVGQMTKARELRALRDDNFKLAQGAIRMLLRHHGVPPSHKRRTAALGRWNSPRKLVLLWRWWAQRPLGPDDPILAHLAWYRSRDYHLWEWEANARRKAIERRRHAYANAAAALARRYGTLVMDSLDLRAMAERPDPESDRYEERSDVSQSQRTLAAPGELREAVVWAFRSRGGAVEECEAGKTPEQMLVRTARKKKTRKVA